MIELNTIEVARAEEWLARLPSSSVPLFLFSPPYNLGRRAPRSGALQGITRSERLRGHYADDAPMGARGGQGKWKRSAKWLDGAYEGYDDNLPWEEYTAWQHQILRECWRALADDGAIFYVHKPRCQSGELILPTIYNPGLSLRQVVIWDRGGGVNMATTHLMPKCEWIMVLAKPLWRLRSKGVSGLGDVWSIPFETHTWHPAPFPLGLALRVLDVTAAPVVYDPFMGSGTTARAARLLGRSFAGCDRSAAYVERAMRELAATGLRQRVQEIGPMFGEEAA